MHDWVRKLKLRGEALPKNQDDLIYKYKRDRPIKKSVLKFDMKKPKFSKTMIRQRVKWGPHKKLMH